VLYAWAVSRSIPADSAMPLGTLPFFVRLSNFLLFRHFVILPVGLVLRCWLVMTLHCGLVLTVCPGYGCPTELTPHRYLVRLPGLSFTTLPPFCRAAHMLLRFSDTSWFVRSAGYALFVHSACRRAKKNTAPFLATRLPFGLYHAAVTPGDAALAFALPLGTARALLHFLSVDFAPLPRRPPPPSIHVTVHFCAHMPTIPAYARFPHHSV